MASRPRAHVLEEESRRAFTNYLPSEWVVDTPKHDYGIDYQVHIFENGDVTPFMFFAQMKASDDVTYSNGRPAYPFKTKRLREYVNQGTPVMLVRYDATTDRMYYDWVHNIYRNLDSELRKKWHLQKTVTLSLAHSLNDTSHELLDREVRRQLYSLGYKQINDIFSISIPEDQSELETWITRDPVMKFVRIEKRGRDAKIDFDEKNMALRLFIGRDEYNFPYRYALSPEDKLACMKYAVAFALSIGGRSAAALNVLGKIIVDEAQLQDVKNSFLINPSLAKLYASENRISEALDIAQFLLESGEIQAANLLASTALFDQSHSARFSMRYRRIVKKLIDISSDERFRASLYYNIANNLSYNGHCKEAIICYCTAAQLDSTYRERAYWWAELAGCLFLRNKYCWAENYYRKALTFAGGEDKPLLKMLIADCLLFQGNFRKASMLFDQSQNKYPYAQGILKEWAAKELYAQFGDTVLNPTKSLNALQAAEEADSPEEKRKKYVEALNANPLSSLAWYNYSASLEKLDANRPRATVITAVLSEWDVESWAVSILIMFTQAGHVPLEIVEPLIVESYRLFNNELESYMYKILQQSGHPKPEQMIKGIALIFQESQAKYHSKRPPIIRFN